MRISVSRLGAVRSGLIGVLVSAIADVKVGKFEPGKFQ
jgi:hypothetical protein